MQKEEELKKASEDMKFYKLELINRENSFNNIFGGNPSVGVVNPVKSATNFYKIPSSMQQQVISSARRKASI